MNERIDNQYYPIPAWVFSVEELELPSEKLTLGFICSLAGQRGYCYASNAYIANLVGVSSDRISKIITKLKRCELISCEITYKQGSKEVEQRRVYVTTPPGAQDTTPRTTDPHPQAHRTPPLGAHAEVITKSNNKTITKVNNTPLTPQGEKVKSKSKLDSVFDSRSGNWLEPKATKALKDWLSYKRQRKDKIAPITLERLLTKYALDTKLFCEAVDLTISKGWMGLHEPSNRSKETVISKQQAKEDRYRNILEKMNQEVSA